jgi:hypothetical protein
MDKKVLFDESLKGEILDIFDKTVDSDNYIVEKSDPTQRVLSKDGEAVLFNEFAGLKKGSEVFIKSDLISLIDFSKE